MRVTFAEPPVLDTPAGRRLPGPAAGGEGSGDRTGPALPLTAEAQGALVEALGWAGLALWGGGLAWFVADDLASRWSRHHREHRADRDSRDCGVAVPEEAS